MAQRREIPQRELRNNIGAVLREVQSGHSVRVTIRGRPVAELVLVASTKEFLSRTEIERIVRKAPPDQGFAADLETVAGARIDEL